MSKFLRSITEKIYNSNSFSDLTVKVHLCFQYSTLVLSYLVLALNKWILIPYLLQDIPPRESCYVLVSSFRIKHTPILPVIGSSHMMRHSITCRQNKFEVLKGGGYCYNGNDPFDPVRCQKTKLSPPMYIMALRCYLASPNRDEISIMITFEMMKWCWWNHLHLAKHLLSSFFFSEKFNFGDKRSSNLTRFGFHRVLDQACLMICIEA